MSAKQKKEELEMKRHREEMDRLFPIGEMKLEKPMRMAPDELPEKHHCKNPRPFPDEDKYF